MKKYIGIICITASSFFCAITHAGVQTQTFGAEYYIKSTEAPAHSWKSVTNAIQSVTNKKTVVKAFENKKTLLNELSSGKVNFAYLKYMTAKQAEKQNPNINLLAVAVTKDPMTGKTSRSYNSQILVAKDSTIHKLSDLQNKTMAYYSARSRSDYIAVKEKLDARHIHVTWKKFRSEEAAFTAVEKHRADAIGAWDYLIYSNPHKNALRPISTIHGLMNPGIYVNSHYVNHMEQKKLKGALAHVKGPYNIIGFK